MSDLYFKKDYLNGNTLVGYGGFKISTPSSSLPLFHFLTMLCESTHCVYTVNLETGVYFKAGSSPRYCTEEKSIGGFLEAMASYMKDVVDTPSGRKILASILEEGGQEVFWNQYNKMCFLYQESNTYSPDDMIEKIKKQIASCANIKLESFYYKKPKEQ